MYKREKLITKIIFFLIRSHGIVGGFELGV